eukprot:CAMPEP_0195637102 /NCGR_PEP_ID=MMETSP0815-20121206/24238_1 /TAXON_ID=97485 /ORGANISM="Prymnesium parvum, Strain Texoma1" /LENGTH=41 /DNA_ID= /DNA_START= /DNA_END= /DNA_ORIENTATION=
MNAQGSGTHELVEHKTASKTADRAAWEAARVRMPDGGGGAG